MTSDILIITLAATAGLFVLAGAVAAVWLLLRQMEHTRRLERRVLGLPEVPRADRKRPTRESIPPDVRALIDPWSSYSTRRTLEDDCYALRAQGVPWKEVARMLKAQTPEEPEPQD